MIKVLVYYLSFKPEQAEQWEAVAKAYTEETGVQVKVQTAASGTYEQTLKSEIAKKDAPTLFQVNVTSGIPKLERLLYGSVRYRSLLLAE